MKAFLPPRLTETFPCDRDFRPAIKGLHGVSQCGSAFESGKVLDSAQAGAPPKKKTRFGSRPWDPMESEMGRWE
jgi:hypothetical protein